MRYSLFRHFYTACVVIFSVIDLRITYTFDEPNKNGSFNVCETAICQNAAHNIRRSQDESVKPCDDFYEHACARWIRSHERLDDDIDSQTDILEIKKIKRIMLWFQGMDAGNTSETMRKVMDYYTSCVNTDEIERRGLTPLELILSDNGGWPIIMTEDDWNLTRSNLTLKKIHENYSRIFAKSPLFRFAVHPNSDTNDSHILHILPPEFHARENRKSEIKFIRNVARSFDNSLGLKVSRNKIIADAKRMLDFRDALMRLHSSVPRNVTGVRPKYRIRKIATVQKMWDRRVSGSSEYAINWLESIQNVFAGTGIKINETENVALSPPRIIRALAQLLRKFPLRTVVNYIHWVAISNLLPYTNQKVWRTVYDGTPYVRKKLRIPGDRSTCYAEHPMFEGLSYVFAQKFFNRTQKTDISVILNEMKDELISEIEKHRELDSEVILRSKEKLEVISKEIGYPLWYDEPDKMDEYYSDLKVSRDNYFENGVNYLKFWNRKMLKKLRQPYDKYQAESVIVPEDLDAMNFQMPFYHIERPLVMKYGVVGSLAGPLLARTFINESIYEIATMESNPFKKKIKCFIHQYFHLFPKNDFNLTGTMMNIIGDNIGFSLAEKAYTSYKKNHNLTEIKEKILVKYTDEQLFFYALTDRLCETALVANQNDGTNIRLPNKARVNMALSNMKAFSDAFQCETGSLMNPKKKCLFWI